MNTAQRYGKEIAEKMLELQQAFRGELNPHNDYYSDLMQEGVYEDTAVSLMAEDEAFIEEYLHDEMMALVKAVLSADWYGMYCAEDVVAASTMKEYREKEAKQTNEYYHDVNKTLKDFENWMNRHADGIL